MKDLWKDQIQRLNKLQVFKHVKPSIEFESYLSQVKIVKHRQAVTRFRVYPLIGYQLKLDDMRILNIIYFYVQFVTQMRLGMNITTFHIYCSNKRLEKFRETELVDFNCQFGSLDTNNLFLYCVSMNDKNVIDSTARYIYEIMNNFYACI